MSEIKQLTNLEKVNAFCAKLDLCDSCELCQKEGNKQKVYDRSLILYNKRLPLPVVFVGEAPGFCDDRTGIPFTGFFELLVSRCGKCARLGKCFKYFLHRSEAYKLTEEPCPFAMGDEPETISNNDIYVARMKNVPPDMLFAKTPDNQIMEEIVNGVATKVDDPRTAGTLFDVMLSKTGFTRTTDALYWNDKISNHLAEASQRKIPNCTVINTIQCRSYEIRGEGENAIKANLAPTDQQKLMCARHLYNFIHLVRPSVVVATGAHALSSLLGIKPVLNANGIMIGAEEIQGIGLPRITEAQGKEFTCALVPNLGYDLKVVPMLHPAAHMRLLKAPANETEEERVTRKNMYNSCLSKDMEILRRVHADYVPKG